MKYKRQSIIFIAGVVGLLLVAGAFMTALLNEISQKMNQSANETLLNSTRMIESSLNHELQTDEQLLETFAGLYSKSREFQNPAEVLADFAASTQFYRFSYVDMTGSGFDSTGASVDASELPFEETALSAGAYGYSDAYMGSSGRLQITFQIPIYLDNRQIGALYADKTLTRYNESALFTFNGSSGHAYMVRSDNGSWMIEGAGTDADDVYQLLEKHGNHPDVQQALEKLMQEGKAGTIGIAFNGEPSRLCFLPMDNTYGWYLISIVSQSLLQQESSTIMQMIEITLIVLLVALILITILVLGRQSMKNQEKSRIYREQLFQTISANVDFAFLLFSPDKQRVELVSDNVRVLFDLDSIQVAEHPELLAERCGIPVSDEGWNAFFHGELHGNIRKEYQVGADNNLQRWIEVHLIPVETGQYLAVLHETTSEHHMRDDLAEALRQSQESNQAKTAFFSSVSHDLRTPMNGIVGMVAIAQSNLQNTAKVENCLAKIKVASDHLLSLINQILDMSRIESGKINLKREAVNLPELISGVLLLIKPELTKKGHTLQISSAVLEHDTVIGDTLHLQKILLNLLSNAVKYTPDDGEIQLNIQEQPVDDGRIEVVFQVADNGIGINPEFLSRIFTPFERAEDGRVSKIIGTGLGMAITKNIVDMMGGTIQVDSEVGHGSCFTVTLPFQLSEKQGYIAPDLKGRTVLVADDDPAICSGMRTMMEELGMQVDCVYSGQEAVDAAEQARLSGRIYYAVVIDWKMPGMDGIEAARQIRMNNPSQSPIILLSAYDWEEAEQEAIEAGIDGFLTKPIFRTELLRMLRCHMPDSPDAPRREMRSAVRSHHITGLRVLLAEDNALNREIAEEILRGSGIEVESVENGLMAVQQVERHDAGYYGMIFLDIHMPLVDGYTAAREIRELPEKGQVPIIAMTADTFDEDIQRCKAAGMDAHIAKPIDFSILFDTIRRFWKNEDGGHS
ncbi:response regulator [Oscillibacter hominis]|uniref:Circadian input-output histidine kinase CikA n=1 Tax=Oscillibacter hominis TaxID=2763056 RepID=A0A7G9B1E2_9FIRM|nr:hybrid sensor histidine kinase/response regulator [Oscillibacter hominis]QNL43373.1 response regulator [Oscillibacter hominis]